MPTAAASCSLGLDPAARHAEELRMSRKERGRKEVMHMPTYKIMRIYEVPGDNQIEATNRMTEALVFHVERDYHVADYVKAPGEADGKGHRIGLEPPKGWLKLLVEQILGTSAE
jgi:hypothetical protein